MGHDSRRRHTSEQRIGSDSSLQQNRGDGDDSNNSQSHTANNNSHSILSPRSSSQGATSVSSSRSSLAEREEQLAARRRALNEARRRNDEMSRKIDDLITGVSDSPFKYPRDRSLRPSPTDKTETESNGSGVPATTTTTSAERTTNNTKPNSRKRTKVVVACTFKVNWCLMAGFVVVLIVVGAVAFFVARPESAEPILGTFFPPSSQSLPCMLLPPLPEDCEQVRNGEAVQGEDWMTEWNFDVVLDIAVGVQVKQGGRGGVTPDEIMELLELEMQFLLMPKLVGCGEGSNRKLRHHRMLSTNSNNPYIVGNGKVQWIPALLEERGGCSSKTCFTATFNMDLFLKFKCAEEKQNFDIENLVRDIFGDDLVNSVPLQAPAFDSVRVRSVIHNDPFAPSATPSLAPTSTPSVAPSDRPSQEPSAAPTISPSLIPSTTPTSTPSLSPSIGPSEEPSTVPTLLPSIAPTTQGPTVSPTPGPTLSPTMTASPTTTPSLVPTMNPTVAPTLHPTPLSTPNPTMLPSSSPTASNQLAILGRDQSPSSVYPLRECAGDCDNDDDCAGGLFCFERNALEAVSGCIGTGESQMDYCYNPGSGFKRLNFIGNEENDYYALGQCEGDCDYDSDCGIGFVCYDRDGGDSGNVPTCVGNANTIGFGDDDFCIPRPASNTLMSVFESEVGGDVAGGGIFPIPRCAGDCDSDTDCEPGLTCFQRTGYNAVPGCSGFGEEDFDYCI